MVGLRPGRHAGYIHRTYCRAPTAQFAAKLLANWLTASRAGQPLRSFPPDGNGGRGRAEPLKGGKCHFAHGALHLEKSDGVHPTTCQTIESRWLTPCFLASDPKGQVQSMP